MKRHNVTGVVHMDQMKFGLAEKIRETTVSRRGFLLTSLAGGFAVASEPVFAQAIKTDTQGITVPCLPKAVTSR
jgi:hypothetical protein